MTLPPGTSEPAPPAEGPAPVCYRHPDRVTYIVCQRCGRPICPDCMHPAAVGFQCPDCVAEGRRTTRVARAPFGGAISVNTATTAIVLIGVNLLAWLLITSNAAWVDRLALLPQTQLFRSGGSVVEIRGVAGGPAGPGGAWWQIVTSLFAHQAVLHIGFNMFALWQFMQPLEMVLGRVRVLAVYFVAGLAGSAAVMWFASPHTQTLGASGAIFGLVGGHMVVAKRIGADLTGTLSMIVYLFLFTFLMPGVSWQGHLGGFLGGALATAAIAYAPRQRRGLVQALGIVVLAALILGSIAVRVSVLQA